MTAKETLKDGPMLTKTPQELAPQERPWKDLACEVARDQAQLRGPGWYVVHCVGKSDNYVLSVLLKMHERRRDDAYRVYYPMMRELRALPRRKLSRAQRAADVEIMKPQLVRLFPRYLFVWFDLATDDWRDVFDIAGVRGMICSGGLPVRMTDKDLNRIRSKEVDGAVPGKIDPRLIFEVGDEVRIQDGPFRSFTGIVESGANPELQDIDSDTRIRVAVAIFGRSSPVELTLSQVSKA